MYKRILTSLTVPFVLAGAVATGTASARHAWAVPSSSTQTEVAGQSQPALVAEKLGEVGAWAVQTSPKQTVALPTVSQQLGEFGAWAVPSPQQTDTKPLVS
jgi:hypothetical protein